MHTNLKAVALFIMAAIYPVTIAGLDLDPDYRQETLYNTVETLLFTDEQKADLYARLAEQLKADMSRPEAMRIIERAIHVCQYPG